MKNFFGLKRVFLIALIILVVMLSVGCSKKDVEEDVTDFLDSDYVSVSNYLSQNVRKFAKDYNESEETEGEFKASYVENKFEIIIDQVFYKQKGMFLDFDGDNGYAVVGDDYTLFDLEIEGKSPYYGIVTSECCYSTFDGYLYLKDGEYVNIDETKNVSYKLDEPSFLEHYDGQDSDESGVGSIENTDAYVENRYGKGFILSINKSIPMGNKDFPTQSELSVYSCNCIENNVIETDHSEGNCWVVAAYFVLQSLADAKGKYKDLVESMKIEDKPSMPCSTIKDINNKIIANTNIYNPAISEPNTYSLYYDTNGNYIGKVLNDENGNSCNEKRIKTNISFPVLYIDVREFVDREYENIVDGGYVWQTMRIINEIGKKYGYSFKASSSIIHDKLKGIASIDNGLPFIFSTCAIANTSYGNHTMAGCGYRVYKRVTDIGILKYLSVKYFYEFYDGHEPTPRYLDISAYFFGSSIGVLNEYNSTTNKNGIKY